MPHHAHHLTPAESGALALDGAARALDHAHDPQQFIAALEHNRQVWQILGKLAQRKNWQVPDARMAAYALDTANKMGRGVSDEQLNTLIDINRQVSAHLAGGDLDHLNHRAQSLWAAQNHQPDQDMDHWLIQSLKGDEG